MENISQIITFIKEVEKLKSVTRTSWTTTGRRESTAEHSWRLAMFLMLLEDEFKDIDIKKAMKMCLIHDLGEIYEGDISAVLQVENDVKYDIEERDVKKVLQLLPNNINEELYDLWKEYNDCSSKEAEIVKALDKLETIIQHNQGDNPKDFNYEFNLGYGKKYCENDEKLKYIRNIVDEDTKANVEKQSFDKAVIEDKDELLNNLDKLHTTELGVERIKKNLLLDTNDVVEWCKKKIKLPHAIITINGKNWYINIDGVIITVNRNSHSIITAHKEKIRG